MLGLACGGLLLACSVLLSACGGQNPRSANQAQDGSARPPLARITFTSQKAGSLQLGDRVAIFDRVARLADEGYNFRYIAMPELIAWVDRKSHE